MLYKGELMIKYVFQKVPYNLKLIYLMLFNRNAYLAHRDYVNTDYRQKCIHIMEAMNYAKVSELPLVYLEFGCHSGRTFSAAVRASRELGILDKTQFYAFDSFEGLPATSAEDGIFKGGTFRTGITEFKSAVKKQADFNVCDANIIQGFYSESLNLETMSKIPSAGVIHIDVDLYSSAIEVLSFVKPLIVAGTVILFDDFFCFPAGSNKGESRALNEFLSNNPDLQVIEWKNYSSFGKSFFVTKVKMGN